jgi:hypothetical protein
MSTTYPGAAKRKIKPADQQVQCSVMVRIPLQLTSQRTFPVRKHELDRAVQVGVAQSPRNFLLEFQVF